MAAEQAVLGAMLMSGPAIDDVAKVCTDVDFYRPAHQVIAHALVVLHAQGAATDPVSVANQLTRDGDLKRCGGAPYLHSLYAAVPTAANAIYHARIVAEHAERRGWIEYGSRIAQAADDLTADLTGLRQLAAQRPTTNGEGRAQPARRLLLTPASEIKAEPVIWGWEDGESNGRIPAGSLGLAAGREGTGKSSYAVWLAAQVTTGSLPGSLAGEPRSVIYVAVEDSWKFTIVPRLMAVSADLSRVFRAEVETIDGDTVTLSLPADNKVLAEAIDNHGVALVVLDPLMSAINDALDTHVNRQVRQALDPLARIADQTGAMLLGIAHFNKSSSTDASSLVTGSGAFKDVARYIFAFATDPGDGIQVITQTKNSLGRSDLPSLAYRIVSATVPTAKGDANVGRFVPDGETDRNVTEILTVMNSAPAERDEKTRAEGYLKKALAAGPRRTKEVEEEAREVHGISQRTLNRARADLRIPAAKRNSGAFGKDGRRASQWWIALPEHEGDLKAEYRPSEDEAASPAKTAKDASSPSPGDVGILGSLASLDGSVDYSLNGQDPRALAESPDAAVPNHE
jgi:hypothetical protein